MEPTRRFVVIIITLSLLKFQEFKGIRTSFNIFCAPLFNNLAEYENCAVEQLQRVKDCCARWANDNSINCNDLMNFGEMETSLGEKLEDSDIATLYPTNSITTRHVDYAVRYIVDRNHQLRGTDARYYYVPSALTSILIDYEAYNEFNEINFVRLTGKILIMPFVKDFHWMVMIVEIANKVVRYYDSMDPLLQTPDSLFNAHSNKDIFVQMLERRNVYDTPDDYIDTTGWELLTAINERLLILNTQWNDYDCGIYALMFIEQVLNQLHPTQPDVYRNYLIETIFTEHRYKPSPELKNRSRYYSPTQMDTENGLVIIPGCAE